MKQIKIVVTGGPSGGKTTLIEALKKELGSKVVLIPEAASILYKGGFPRLKSKSSAHHTQLSIYHVQKELEAMLAREQKKSPLVVCDRGSLDGVAYWPLSEKNFFCTLKTNREAELARYDWVLHLDTAAKDFYDYDNPIRTESFNQAQVLNLKVKKAWKNHPQRFIITQKEDFLSKMTLSLAVIRAILDGQNMQQIKQELL
jgi:nicotinamide riboside kinase